MKTTMFERLRTGTFGVLIVGMCLMVAVAEAQAQFTSNGAALAEADDFAALSTVGEMTAERQFRAALRQPCSVEFSNMPLADVMAYFSGLTGFTITFDSQSLEESAIALDQSIDYTGAGLSIGSALDDCMRPLYLTWIARSDGSLLITTRTQAEQMLSTRVYPVRDLVETEFTSYISEDYEPLMEAITGSILQTSWGDVGGAGAIKPFRLASALIISQTREGHEQVENLLAMLRRARDVQGGPRLHAAPLAAPTPSESPRGDGLFAAPERVYINQR